MEYNKDTKVLTWRRPKAENQKAREQGLYEQLPFCDVADVFRFVNGQCQFLSALTPLQPRYAKKVADADSLMAVIIAQAMNHGNQVMAHQRHPLPCAGVNLPAVPTASVAERGQRLHQQCHCRAADLPSLLVRPEYTVRCRRRPKVRRRTADREGTLLAQILRAWQGRGRWLPTRCYATTCRSTAI